MDKLFIIFFPKGIVKKIIEFIPKKIYKCLYCGHVYYNRNIKFNDINNCPCYYKWIYFHAID